MNSLNNDEWLPKQPTGAMVEKTNLTTCSSAINRRNMIHVHYILTTEKKQVIALKCEDFPGLTKLSKITKK